MSMDRTPSRRTRTPGDEIVEFLKPYLVDFFNKFIEEAKSISNLEKNEEDLSSEMRALREYKRELLREVEILENDGSKKRRIAVRDWMEKVDSLTRTVDDFQDRFCKRTPCFVSCSLGTFWYEYKLSKSVMEYLVRVRKLDEEKRDFRDLQNMVIEANSFDLPNFL